MDTDRTTTPPTLALAMGDPAGISAELTAKALCDANIRKAARLVVFGARRLLDVGATQARVSPDITIIADGDPVPGHGNVFVDLGHFDPAHMTLGEPSQAGGAFAITNFRRAIGLASEGGADAVTFTPFNKVAMRMAHPGYEDEVVFLCDELGATDDATEFNILPGLWNARVTSHVPISGVAQLITRDRVLAKLMLTDRSLRAAGVANPRIAVAALNPHAGDGGNFGREDIDEIAPAIQAGRERGIACDGPFPSDTVFVRARRGDHDAVLTMYHDQGQIAMKLLGFEAGVTLIAGFLFPVCTPAHGTAYDIAGQGIADVGATRHALLLAARMAGGRSSALTG